MKQKGQTQILALIAFGLVFLMLPTIFNAVDSLGYASTQGVVETGGFPDWSNQSKEINGVVENNQSLELNSAFTSGSFISLELSKDADVEYFRKVEYDAVFNDTVNSGTVTVQVSDNESFSSYRTVTRSLFNGSNSFESKNVSGKYLRVALNLQRNSVSDSSPSISSLTVYSRSLEGGKVDSETAGILKLLFIALTLIGIVYVMEV